VYCVTPPLGSQRPRALAATVKTSVSRNLPFTYGLVGLAIRTRTPIMPLPFGADAGCSRSWANSVPEK